MAKRGIAVSVLALFAASGYGTAMNLTQKPSEIIEPKRPYGGLLLDGYVSAACVTNPEICLVSLGALLDIPFTAIGDTLALPYVFYLNSHLDEPASTVKTGAAIQQGTPPVAPTAESRPASP